MANEQTINIPQLLLVLFLGGLAIRYFFFSSPAGRHSHTSSSASSVRAREADVEMIQQMFPQLARRTIMWDLQRNGGNVAATTERILGGGSLEIPPQSFQPPSPPSVSTATSAPSVVKPAPTDLITRYNLSSKLGAEGPKTEPPTDLKQSWSQNKGDRQALLQKRREEMIIAARRRMEAKLAAETSPRSQ
ncbi:MAG: hypothetical protein M1818_000867 [Claussenomyces sp. TS43310]|nr:MAG: hypothetical protein M1818_000867 [Claussenomyces sp. TS43310]